MGSEGGVIQLSEWKTPPPPPKKEWKIPQAGKQRAQRKPIYVTAASWLQKRMVPPGLPPPWRPRLKIPWGEDERTHTTPLLISRPLCLAVSQGARNVHTESPLGFQNNSVSPSESLRASEKHRGSADYSMEAKKRKAEEKDSLSRYVRLVGATRPGLGAGAWEHLQA